MGHFSLAGSYVESAGHGLASLPSAASHGLRAWVVRVFGFIYVSLVVGEFHLRLPWSSAIAGDTFYKTVVVGCRFCSVKAMKRGYHLFLRGAALKRRPRCPIPLNGMDCQFPNCGCDLPPDEPEATTELKKIVSTANVPVRHFPPANRTVRSKPPSSSVRSLGREAVTTPNAIPGAFVWTKIQAEAGQSIKRILNRKELERQASDGTFWWGRTPFRPDR